MMIVRGGFMKCITLFFIILSGHAFSQKTLLIGFKDKPQLGKEVKVKLRSKKIKKKRIKYRSIPSKRTDIHLSVGTYHNGRIFLPNEVDEIQDHQIEVKYRDLKTSSEWYDTTLVLDYSGHMLANFSGKNGEDGSSGGSVLGFLLSLIGRNGNDGSDGTNGKKGGDGQDIHVEVDAYYDSLLQDSLIRTTVRSGLLDKKSTYLINPMKGMLTISARGGDGGDGGDGANGSNGKDARPETEKKSAKSAGCGGDGGDGGDGAPGGDGGSITMTVHPSARNYMYLIELVNDAGRGGNGGACGLGGDGGGGCPGLPSGRDGSNGDHGLSAFRGEPGPEPLIIFLDE